MAARYATAAELRRAISTEIWVAAGLPRHSPLQPLLQPLVWPPAHRFANLAAEFDRRVALDGWTAAMQWVVPHFVDGVEARGADRVPATGPLVVASNHPGSYDSLAIASSLGRDDLRILVSDVPFLRSMYAASRHFIYTGPDPHQRMVVLRESERHLQAGGALLVFATGVVDPDPALLPGAAASLQDWSPSLALLLRRVPDSRLVATLVSGVLAPSALHHPLTRLRREPRMRQFLAEFIQISQQVWFGRRFGLRPQVRYAAPLSLAGLEDELGARASRAAILDAIRARAQGLLDESGPVG